MKNRTRWLKALLPALLLTVCPLAIADVSLPRLLGDGLVLQRDTPNTIWGWAADDEQVVVKLDGKKVASGVVSDGQWQVTLGPRPAGGPHQLEITGANRVEINDIFFGEVWVASGQSNMQLPMERVKEKFEKEIALSDYPLIRMFTVPREYNFNHPQADLSQGEWLAASPENLLDFSAVGFFFARDLYKKLNVPIGIVSSNYGGSAAESWMSEEALQAFPHYLDVARKYRDQSYLESLIEADQATEKAWYGALDSLDSGLAGPVRWFENSYDAESWQSITLPALLENSGLAPFNGAIWLKKEFTLPASQAGKPARLMLGRMVDADTTYVNGIHVGSTTYQYPPRRYTVDKNILLPGKNTITVRLISTAGSGGFIADKPYWIGTDELKIELDGTWKYKVGAVTNPLPPPVFLKYKQPLGFYNAMLAPLLNLSIKGVIWYQGESNTDRPREYVRLFPALIQDWRRQWGQGDFPFLFVQLANFMEAQGNPSESHWAETRQAQFRALKEPNTAMVVTIDIGEWNDIHPLDKKTVGQRLALAARKKAYDEASIVSSGPLYKSMEIRGSTIALQFENQGSELVARGENLSGFAIAGEDGKYVWAEAKISNDEVIVWSNEIEKPLHVRYAWADNPDTANLYNTEGLPASPFQTAR